MIFNLKNILVVLICASFLVLFAPVRATEYNPGVKPGDWVEYRNLVSSGPYNPEDFNVTEWMKMEVIRVSGSRVTVHTSRRLINGSFQDGNIDYVFDVATTETDRSSRPSELWSNYFVIAGNLIEGSNTSLGVMLPQGSALMSINRTETKDLLGLNRTINMIDYKESSDTFPDYSYEFHAAYDQVTGMLLELNYSQISNSMPSTNEMVSYSAVEINTTPKSSDNSLIYVIAIIAIAVVVVVVAALVVRRRKAHPIGSVQKVPKKKTRK